MLNRHNVIDYKIADGDYVFFIDLRENQRLMDLGKSKSKEEGWPLRVWSAQGISMPAMVRFPFSQGEIAWYQERARQAQEAEAHDPKMMAGLEALAENTFEMKLRRQREKASREARSEKEK